MTSVDRGWLRGLRDPWIARALTALHEDLVRHAVTMTFGGNATGLRLDPEKLTETLVSHVGELRLREPAAAQRRRPDAPQAANGTSTAIPQTESRAPFPLREAGSFDGPRIDQAVGPEHQQVVIDGPGHLPPLNASRRREPEGRRGGIEPLGEFYPAEDYHQDYATLNPMQPYILINDKPKIGHMAKYFPDHYRAKPVLAAAADACLDHNRLDALLWAQGIPRHDWVED